MSEIPIFRWTTEQKVLSALRRNRLSAGRWIHYLEHEERTAKGSSWSRDPDRWRRHDTRVCLVANREKIKNPVHAINGNRTHFLTLGRINPLFDPNAFRHESTEPDEEFVEGSVSPLSEVLWGVVITSSVDRALARDIQNAARLLGVTVHREDSMESQFMVRLHR